MGWSGRILCTSDEPLHHFNPQNHAPYPRPMFLPLRLLGERLYSRTLVEGDNRLILVDRAQNRLTIPLRRSYQLGLTIADMLSYTLSTIIIRQKSEDLQA